MLEVGKASSQPASSLSRVATSTSQEAEHVHNEDLQGLLRHASSLSGTTATSQEANCIPNREDSKLDAEAQGEVEVVLRQNMSLSDFNSHLVRKVLYTCAYSL
jgi:hypothetical protein